MKLRAWIKLKKSNIKEFREHIEVSRDTMRRILQGKNITIEIAMRIEIATKGNVMCEDLISEEKLKELQRFKNF